MFSLFILQFYKTKTKKIVFSEKGARNGTITVWHTEQHKTIKKTYNRNVNLPISTLLPISLAILMLWWSMLRIWPNRARFITIDWGQNWTERMPTYSCHGNTANKKTPTPRGQKYIDSI